jgi:hypothetical protein
MGLGFCLGGLRSEGKLGLVSVAVGAFESTGARKESFEAELIK